MNSSVARCTCTCIPIDPIVASASIDARIAQTLIDIWRGKQSAKCTKEAAERLINTTQEEEPENVEADEDGASIAKVSVTGECVGHVQKRLGTALRRYKLNMKGKKLTDIGPLTDKVVDKMQNLYGQAIRKNSANLEA
eukprot:gene14808-5915_t